MNSNPATRPNGKRTYTLILHGELDADFVSAFCPPGTALLMEGKTIRLTNLCVDQSGLLGVLRSLHNLGCVFSSLFSEPGET